MSDNIFSLIPDNAITELSKQVYTDIGHPVLKEVGNIGESVMKLVALPFKFLGLTADELEAKYSNFLKKTINKVPQVDCVIPKSVVAAPLLEHVKFVFDENGLSEMFSNLLANAMSANIEKMVHPAFVEMLKQMSPLDVEFMNLYFAHSDLVEVSELTWARGNLQKSLAVDSLSRLGIINSISYDDRDDVALVLSNLGKVFRNLCMLSPSDIDPEDFFNEDDTTLDDEFINPSDIGLMFQDSFATARKSTENDRIYVRESFQMEDVRKGSFIILLLRISNTSEKKVKIDSLYIECGAKKHIITDNPLPAQIASGKYQDFIFIASDENKLLEEAIKEQARYILQTGASIYDLPVTNVTKKEIELFIKYNNERRQEV